MDLVSEINTQVKLKINTEQSVLKYNLQTLVQMSDIMRSALYITFNKNVKMS